MLIVMNFFWQFDEHRFSSSQFNLIRPVMSTSKIAAEPVVDHGSKVGNDKPSTGDALDETLYTINDLLLSRCRTIPDVPLVAYPGKGKADYVHYTANDLDRFADEGAKKYVLMGLAPDDDVCQSTW